MSRVLRDGFKDLPVAQWTADEAFAHLEETFNRATKNWPDVMEPYVVMLSDAANEPERLAIMRSGLRLTVAARYGANA